jgi:tetratricopeptide (TPR) repeat protein
LYKQGKFDDANKQYMQASGLSKDPVDQARTNYNLGNTLMKSEKYQESVDAYKMALRQNPNDEDARYNLSYALSKLKQQQQQENKDNKQQNKDKQNKDQQKQDQQNKDQQKQDQQKQDQQKQDQKDNKDQQQAKEKKQPKISKEEAERMLQALKNEEKNLQKKKAKKFEATSGNPEKDW